MPRRKGDKGDKPKNTPRNQVPKSGTQPIVHVRNNNDDNTTSNSVNNQNNKKIFRNVRKSFRVVVLFKKDVKHTNDNILKTLKISSTGMIKYKINLPITRMNLLKYVEYFHTKENSISSLNIVTNNGFWTIGLNNAQNMETEDDDIFKYLEPID
ncbi:hypothetical protein ABK040_004463 [Willaertia magna]